MPHTDIIVGGLLKGQVGDLMDKLLSYMWRWLKTMMKQMIVMAEKGTKLIEEN
jgi:hypothetical protein